MSNKCIIQIIDLVTIRWSCIIIDYEIITNVMYYSVIDDLGIKFFDYQVKNVVEYGEQ